MTGLSNETVREIARWLAPYVAEEIAGAQRRGSDAIGAGEMSVATSDYDPSVCAEYVRELGQGVLNRATDFFSRLEQDGRVGSLELAQVIGTDTPRNIPANLTNSLKQRARRMNLAVPWDETVSEDDRTVWLDRDGIAARMVEAIRAEQQRRAGRG